MSDRYPGDSRKPKEQTPKQPSSPQKSKDYDKNESDTREIFMKSIILIGMPGAGNSTAGVILAKALRMRFVDTDLLIQERTGRLLQEILNREGPAAFHAIEEETILSLRPKNAVIATGGSVVLSDAAMAHLKSTGVVVYLEISYGEMERRLKNITTRGIVLLPGQSLRQMYEERVPLYEKYADITIDCSKEDFETVVGNVIETLPPA